MEKNIQERQVAELTFGQAVSAMSQGYRVQREGWNGKGLFVFMQIPATIDKDIIPKMQSLPETVKAEFARRFEATPDGIHQIHYNNQMALVNPDNTINGWAPSSSDALASDWIVLD